MVDRYSKVVLTVIALLLAAQLAERLRYTFRYGNHVDIGEPLSVEVVNKTLDVAVENQRWKPIEVKIVRD